MRKREERGRGRRGERERERSEWETERERIRRWGVPTGLGAAGGFGTGGSWLLRGAFLGSKRGEKSSIGFE